MTKFWSLKNRLHMGFYVGSIEESIHIKIREAAKIEGGGVKAVSLRKKELIIIFFSFFFFNF